jgi:alpha-amylase/alpha-mannosidase (GH57 family)
MALLFFATFQVTLCSALVPVFLLSIKKGRGYHSSKRDTIRMDRYVCIHGHFYQPPRENPWLEAIELQDSAYPYHDWNARITAECYAPNATSRILDEKNRIVQMVNNYAKMSFNFGPTLLAWMEKNAVSTYQAILEADQESQERFSGHGSALAQAYNHMILPLANSRDRLTQVMWGIQDFMHRFGRKPEGMWLPETAVDLETLQVLAEQRIRFTILSPHQASRIRPLDGGEWEDVTDAKIDTTMPYLLNHPSGRGIMIFFYNGPISRAVAFEKLLSSGESFARRIVGGFSERDDRPQLVHIATDGESYGHHHRFGDMALAYAFDTIQSKGLAHLTNYGAYLEKNPPTHEVEILENTSWSCVHGVERWKSNCGCHTGNYPDWNQKWRTSLREALDAFRDTLNPMYEEKAGLFLKDPWEARNDYIQVILDRSPANVDKFLGRHGTHDLNEVEKIAALKALELQRHLMLMYTSCGWFFDDVSGIETVQILQYAARTLQLAREILDQDLEPPFLTNLAQAKSNVPEYGDGRLIYERFVRPSVADLKKVGAHYAICSLFREYETQPSFYCYRADQEEVSISEAGKARLLTGKARFISEITEESAVLSFGTLHLGDHNLTCGVKEFENQDAYQGMLQDLSSAFEGADFPETIRRLDRQFEGSTYSLKSLFRDEENRILGLIAESALEDAEGIYRQLYEDYAPLMRFFRDSDLPPPKALSMVAEFILSKSLRNAFETEPFDFALIESYLEETKGEGVTLDAATLEFSIRKRLERMASALSADPTNRAKLQELGSAVALLKALPFQVNLWTVQNICYDMIQSTYGEIRNRAAKGDETAQNWVNHFISVAEGLSLIIP